jgi:putative ABC transport system substrate-binding protein
MGAFSLNPPHLGTPQPKNFESIQPETALAITHRIPTASVIRGFATDGGLMAFQSKEVELYRQSASYVDKVLKGANPADLPVQQPSKFELIINMRTANAISLAIPSAFLARADEVIE